MADQVPMSHPGPMAPQTGQGRVDVDVSEVSFERDAVSLDRAVVSMLIPGKPSPDAVMPGGILAMVRGGLPFASLKNLVQAVGAPQGEVASVLGMPNTTLRRRRSSGRLTLAESDHVVRVARLTALARELMAGDADAASRWLTTPHRLLGDEAPLHRASTEAGGREVEQLIGQLRHGVFS